MEAKWVVRLSGQDCDDLHTYALCRISLAVDQSPQVVLVARLADHFQVFAAVKKCSTRPINHPGGTLGGRGSLALVACRLSFLVLLKMDILPSPRQVPHSTVTSYHLPRLLRLGERPSTFRII